MVLTAGRAALLLAVIALVSCRRGQEAEAPKPRPVRTVTVGRQTGQDTVVLTGHIRAKDEVAAAFRIGGRVIERPVNVGDVVRQGQELARLDRQDEMDALRSAEANVAAAQAAVTQTRAAFERQRSLLASGHTPRAQFDLAQKAYQNAQAQADSAAAQASVAANRVAFTILTADFPGVVTARGAEPGEVVQAGQMIVRIAREGERDAVFDVPAQLLNSAPKNPAITVTLTDNPAVTTSGRVREVSPQADPVTRTFEVRVALDNPPEAMRLGSTVNGALTLDSGKVVAIPASALTEQNGKPAVWIVDPAHHAVSLRAVGVSRFDPDSVVVSNGLEPGDIVVTAGVQALHPGQEVRLLSSSS
jgi:RND family efflux transporter MFP subunit